MTTTDRSLTGEKGFLLANGTFNRFEPVGVTWNDSYCRRITNEGPLGCFVERDINMFPIADLDDPRNNCSGSDISRFFPQRKKNENSLVPTKILINALDSNGKSAARVNSI